MVGEGGIEKMGVGGCLVKVSLGKGEKKVIEKEVGEDRSGVELILESLSNGEYGGVRKVEEMKGVGEGVVEGGRKLRGCVVIEEGVIGGVEEWWEVGGVENGGKVKGM